MPKNTTGGKRAKSMARKRQGGGEGGRLRLPESEFERVAVVSKMLGNGMFRAKIDSGEELLGHIRGKYTGRSKRDNFVSCGSIILVGLRDWEAELKNCDLLEVYADTEMSTLAGIIDLSFANGSAGMATRADDVVFVTSTVDAEDEDEVETSTNGKELSVMVNNVKISVDDI